MQPSPVVELNRAAAVAMAEGCAAGLLLLDELEERGELRGYFLLPAARADLLRRMEQWDRAADAYRAALALVGSDAERKFLMRRIDEVAGRARSADGARE
jgi:RNA polymerase sigma-70 factor (ECF subfamily)